MMIPELMTVGPGTQALFDRDAQRSVGVVSVIAKIAHDGKPGRQHLHAVGNRLDGTDRGRVEDVSQVIDVVLGIRLVREREVIVRVHQSGKNSEIR